jgi:hypothetical protein
MHEAGEPAAVVRGFPWMVVLTHSISGADHLRRIEPELRAEARLRGQRFLCEELAKR